MTRFGATLAAAILAGGCASVNGASPPLPTESEWLAARAWLAELRAAEPTKPFVSIVRVSLHDPRTGRTFSARGAVAIDPHQALRMILVGPAGATALDVWATPSKWRFEVPPAHLLKRGGREDDPGIPIGFFRWWFLAPFEGRLLTSVAGGGSERFILRDGAATVDLTDTHMAAGHKVTASRLWQGNVDRIAFEGPSFAAAAGDHAVYDQDSTGIHVEVTVEAPSDAPDPLAFEDPDSPEAAGAGR